MSRELVISPTAMPGMAYVAIEDDEIDEMMHVVVPQTQVCPPDHVVLPRAEVEALRALLHDAHKAMMDWHLVHDDGDYANNPEAARMGEVCRAIQDYDLRDRDAAGEGA